MTNLNASFPKDYDAVLGRPSPAPKGAVILGGIEGIKKRLENPAIEVRQAALPEALKYGEAGLDLILKALHDPVNAVKYSAYWLLKDRQDLKVQQHLINVLPAFKFDAITVDRWGREKTRDPHTVEFFPEELGEGICLEMILVPGGQFMRGSPEIEEGRYDRESPQHVVKISPVLMSKYPITQIQWQAVSRFPQINRFLNPNPSFFKGNLRPVEQISWHDAVEFCARLSRKTGRIYRLPSEAEWEYACRSGHQTPFTFGETLTPDLANYRCDFTYGAGPKGIYRKQTTTVGTFPPNAFGLSDMHGNVWEWCADRWRNNYQGDFVDGRVMQESGDLLAHPLRGGGWNIQPAACRSASRMRATSESKHSYLGFRVVVEFSG